MCQRNEGMNTNSGTFYLFVLHRNIQSMFSVYAHAGLNNLLSSLMGAGSMTASTDRGMNGVGIFLLTLRCFDKLS